MFLIGRIRLSNFLHQTVQLFTLNPDLLQNCETSSFDGQVVIRHVLLDLAESETSCQLLSSYLPIPIQLEILCKPPLVMLAVLSGFNKNID